MNVFAKLSAAMAIAMGATFNQYGIAPTIRKGKHRTPADTKAGRQFISRLYRSSNRYADQFNGRRECARRCRQIVAGKLSPLYRGAAA